MPPLYVVLMGLYTVLLAFVTYLVISNTLRSRSVWDQVLAVFVLVPFMMRLFFIK